MRNKCFPPYIFFSFFTLRNIHIITSYLPKTLEFGDKDLIRYFNSPLLFLVLIGAGLAIIAYILGFSILATPINLGDIIVLDSIANLAKDSLFVPLKPLMYALIIMSISSSLAISSGNMQKKLFRVMTFFLIFSVIGAVVAIAGYFLASDIEFLPQPQAIKFSGHNAVVSLPFSKKLYAVLTSPLMISIFCGVIFGKVLKRHNLGTAADQISDLFIDLFRKFLHITIPLAVFGSITIALNAPNGVQTLAQLLPLALVYLLTFALVWIVMVMMASFFLKQHPHNTFNALIPQAIVAFSTSSSIATLPATKTACENLGVDGDESTTFITIGATINMVGTLMGLTMLSLFAMDSFGLEVGLVDAIIVAFQSLIFSISAAGVPSASVVLLQDILTSQGVSVDYAAHITGLIIAIDAIILDRLRTTLNTQSDSISTSIGLSKFNG